MAAPLTGPTAARNYTSEEVTAGLIAVIGSTSYRDASDKLAEEGFKIPGPTLSGWVKTSHIVEYEQMRERLAPQIEARLANNFLDNARLAADTERLAIEAANEELKAGTAKEPSKIARDLSQVKSQNVDKRLSLQGRPTQVVERRDIGEIVRALQGMRVIEVVEPVPTEIGAGNDTG